jgi:hypothetical protein
MLQSSVGNISLYRRNSKKRQYYFCPYDNHDKTKVFTNGQTEVKYCYFLF